MEIGFLSILDHKIFKHFNANHEPATGETFVLALGGGVIIGLIVFILQMCNANETLMNVVIGGGLLIALAIIAKRTLPALKKFSTVGHQIIYGIYVLFTSSIAFTLGVWMLMIAILLLFIWGMLKLFFSGSSSSSSKGRVTFNDGTSRDVKKTGKGFCGETYYEDDEGNTYTKQ